MVCATACPVWTQDSAESESFGINRTPEGRKCHLPIIYFEPESILLTQGYEVDLAYLAYLMLKYKKLQVRIRPDVLPAPDNVAARLLLEERLSFLVAYMNNQHGISRDRFVRDQYKDLSRGYEPEITPVLPLVKRRIVCECVWE